jgi:serine/threonine protein kinase
LDVVDGIKFGDPGGASLWFDDIPMVSSIVHSDGFSAPSSFLSSLLSSGLARTHGNAFPVVACPVVQVQQMLNPAVDVYSYGVCMFELLTLEEFVYQKDIAHMREIIEVRILRSGIDHAKDFWIPFFNAVLTPESLFEELAAPEVLQVRLTLTRLSVPSSVSHHSTICEITQMLLKGTPNPDIFDPKNVKQNVLALVGLVEEKLTSPPDVATKRTFIHIVAMTSGGIEK